MLIGSHILWKNGYTSYTYRIGSEIVSSAEVVDISGTFNSQMLTWAQLPLQSHGNTWQDVYFRTSEFLAELEDIETDSTRPIFAIHLNWYYSSGCGIDLLQNDIVAEFDFDNHGLV